MTGSTPPDPLAPYRGGAYQRLLAAARRSLARTGGSLEATIGITAPREDERQAIIGITGQYRDASVKRLTVSLAAVDAAMRRGCGLGLQAVLERIHARPLDDRPAERAAEAAARRQAMDIAHTSAAAAEPWFAQWLAEISSDGTLTKLVRAGEEKLLHQAVRVLDTLHRRSPGQPPIPIPSLATDTTGYPKTLNQGTLPTLVLRALALRHELPRPKTAEERRSLWDTAEVVVDDLASHVLVLNLPSEGDGLGRWLSDAAHHGMPFRAMLYQLITMPITPITTGPVFVCENPAVLRRAAAHLGRYAAPLICTEGRPATAFHRLANAVTAAGGTLHYHGDFDHAGIAMTMAAGKRHAATPWRMRHQDYLRGLSRMEDRYLLSKVPDATPWDPTLARVMAEHRIAVYEEAVTDDLLVDLAHRNNLPD
ncbi:TIGR02679 family protein [Micromonospora tulbaghiae]|uniref:TIGR02679 family protein n=1 Tax=Micromonospora tulbaghiae TaxID=479978 RepID=A0A386WEE8_9ACTN|nr:TIGR02679 family protein [Micromonospora tulbaghiae]AYF26685.1 TIGR02679 family protein [Micromonospora tulbaghiae]